MIQVVNGWGLSRASAGGGVCHPFIRSCSPAWNSRTVLRSTSEKCRMRASPSQPTSLQFRKRPCNQGTGAGQQDIYDAALSIASNQFLSCRILNLARSPIVHPMVGIKVSAQRYTVFRRQRADCMYVRRMCTVRLLRR